MRGSKTPEAANAFASAASSEPLGLANQRAGTLGTRKTPERGPAATPVRAARCAAADRAVGRSGRMPAIGRLDTTGGRAGQAWLQAAGRAGTTAAMPRSLLSLALAGVWLLAGCSSLEGARLYTRGTRAMDEGRVGEAIAELEQAASLLPDSSPVQNHLGLAYARAGRDEAALAAFRQAVRLDCSNSAAVENLAAAERRLSPPRSGRDTAETSP